jgi:hypothetical protein
MSDARRITITPTAGLSPEVALAAIYRRAIERFEEEKEGGPGTAPDSAKKGSDEFSAKGSIP